MQKPNFISFFVVIVFVLTGISCISFSAPIVDPNAANTSIAQNVNATLTEFASLSLASPTLELTSTFTPSPTLTQTPTAVFTLTPIYAMVSVSVATNCRSGPGTTYDIVGYFLVGESTRVYGRDPKSLYWFIRNPDDHYGFCWISGKYASLSGNLSVVPIYTVQPTATYQPNVVIDFVGLDSCQNWWAEFNLSTSTSSVYKSIKITVLDTVANVSVVRTTDGFQNQNGCMVSVTKTVFDQNHPVVVSAEPFSYDPSGHKLKATIKLCSKKGLTGDCISSTFIFTP
jgi:hypothetical protein